MLNAAVPVVVLLCRPPFDLILKQLQEMRAKLGVAKTPALSPYVLQAKNYEEREAATAAAPASGKPEVRRQGQGFLRNSQHRCIAARLGILAVHAMYTRANVCAMCFPCQTVHAR